MSKFKEVIEKLKAADISVADFAYEELPCNIEDYPEAVEAQRIRKEFVENPNNRDEKGSWLPGKFDEYRALPSEYDIAREKLKKSLGLTWKEVAQYGGEGQGDTWYSVKYFPDLDLYIKVDGYYQSYCGTEFFGWEQSCSEVRPVEKTITVYE